MTNISFPSKSLPVRPVKSTVVLAADPVEADIVVSAVAAVPPVRLTPGYNGGAVNEA